MDSKKYRTIRYMKKKNLNLTSDNSSEVLRERINKLDNNVNLVVRLSVNSPVYVEDALILNRESIQKIVIVE